MSASLGSTEIDAGEQKAAHANSVSTPRIPVLARRKRAQALIVFTSKHLLGPFIDRGPAHVLFLHPQKQLGECVDLVIVARGGELEEFAGKITQPVRALGKEQSHSHSEPG